MLIFIYIYIILTFSSLHCSYQFLYITYYILVTFKIYVDTGNLPIFICMIPNGGNLPKCVGSKTSNILEKCIFMLFLYNCQDRLLLHLTLYSFNSLAIQDQGMFNKQEAFKAILRTSCDISRNKPGVN
jgi:hypothetical protein